MPRQLRLRSSETDCVGVMTSSYLIGACTGRLAGSFPLRMHVTGRPRKNRADAAQAGYDTIASMLP